MDKEQLNIIDKIGVELTKITAITDVLEYSNSTQLLQDTVPRLMREIRASSVKAVELLKELT
jgi:hypothetical protein